MSEQTTVKNRLKRPNGSPQAEVAIVAVPALPPPPPPSTIQISFPTPAPIVCGNPFQALGTADPNTQMSQTARIFTPIGILFGLLDANPPRPFTWSYTFGGPLPRNVPLAIVVSGVTLNGAGNPDEAVVPFECQ
jgi:hypothetical protein